MWKESKRDGLERTGYIVFDSKKAEVNFKQLNTVGTDESAKDPYKAGDKFEGNINVTVIANVHTHPIEDSYIGQNEVGKGVITDKSNFDRQYSAGGDGETSVTKKTARYTVGDNKVDYYSPKGKSDSKNNVTTRAKLSKGSFNTSKDAFKKKI
jgi:hypothetical protein